MDGRRIPDTIKLGRQEGGARMSDERLTATKAKVSENGKPRAAESYLNIK